MGKASDWSEEPESFNEFLEQLNKKKKQEHLFHTFCPK